MALNAEYLLSRPFPAIETEVTPHSCMLYALGIGLGYDPLDREHLSYVFEQNLRVFPTMAAVLGYPGNWMVDPASGITRSMTVHGAQSLRMIRPIRIGATIRAANAVTAVYDKGEGRGAILELARAITDAASGDLLAHVGTQIFCRADGGCGGPQRPREELYLATPARAPDRTIDWPTQPNAALVYRLSGDYNPLHADPDAAAKAGFERPILHGLCTYGAAAAALMKIFRDQDIIEFDARFSQPVFPGETISVDVWIEENEARFRGRVAARDALVLDRGRARFSS